uniref:Thioredoxin peroxidase n=2 Tax=Magallana gigas TaxID=29159 RepID=K1Q615_MAGGI
MKKTVHPDGYHQSVFTASRRCTMMYRAFRQKQEQAAFRTNTDLDQQNPDSNMAELRLTKPAPEFKGQAVVDGEFKDISLANYKGKYLVLFFYPLDFTFVCPTEIIAFSDRVEEFRAINCEVVACSTDSVFSHLACALMPTNFDGFSLNLYQMFIPLFPWSSLKISIGRYFLLELWDFVTLGLFIIDDKGNLRQITMNDLPVGRSVDETLRLVQAFQFTDKHGEVCPAGWKPGADTIRPNVKDSQKYFQKQK